jgi:ATP-dependent DNA helicase RecG
MSGKLLVFVSSAQKEMKDERRAARDFIEGDALLRRFFDVFLFEDLPASGRRPDELYLAEVERSAIYLGLFGNEYGYEDAAGVSPTEQEFDRATATGKERLVFIKGTDDKARHPKMRALIRKASDQLNRRRFGSISELTALLYAALSNISSPTVPYIRDPLMHPPAREPPSMISRQRGWPTSWSAPGEAAAMRSVQIRLCKRHWRI